MCCQVGHGNCLQMPFLGSVDRSCFFLKEDEMALSFPVVWAPSSWVRGRSFPLSPAFYLFLHPFRSQHTGCVLAGTD